MKKITMYEANDGSKHKTEESAIERDNLLSELKIIEDLLPTKPKDEGCRFANGKGFISVDTEKFEEAKKLLIQYAERFTGQNFHNNLHGIIGRYLDDSGSPACTLLYRMQCVDSKYRMWGQPYFAYNPTEGTQEPFKEIEVV